jgi:type I restriction enzyme S subunit
MTIDIASLISDHLGIWTTAVERKSGAGRGGGKRISLYGVDRLRELILDLAVRGKLVPQDAVDEPAAELLKKIASERTRLTKAGVIGKRKTAESNSADAPYTIPEGWVWTRIADIGHDWGQKEPSGDFTYIDVGSIEQRAGIIRSPSVISASQAPSRARKIVKSGTVIYSTVRPYLLNIAIVEQDFNPEPIASTAFAIVHPFEGILASFLYRYLRSATFVAYVEDCQTGIAYPAINDRQFFSAWFPLPPLAEQQRIVAKVDELMALCDALEAESAAAINAHQALVEALLATLLASTAAADLATNWARIEAHFDTLFTTETSIDALKQTILELAVLGKLVPPDNSEEAATALIEKWDTAKQHSFANAADRRIKVTPKPKAPPFDLPPHWEYQSFENIFLFIDYRGNTPPKTPSGIPLITAKNVRMGYLDREPREFIADETFSKWMSRGFPALGDLFFTTEAPLGNICLNDIEDPFAIAQRLICFKPFGATNTRFYMLAIMSPSVQQLLDDHATGMTARGIKAAKLKLIPLPVPPEGEQARIVAKVDELIALCDALKVRVRDATTTQCNFADAVLKQAEG